MTFFDRFRRKDLSAQADISSVERYVTQAVILCMNRTRITSVPVLRFFRDDRGIFDGFVQSRLNSPHFNAVRTAYGTEMYLRLLGCHALGLGAYLACCQERYDKPVNEFTPQEAMEIKNAFAATDVYELALKTLGFSLDGNNKRCLDDVVSAAVDAYTQAAGAHVTDRDSLGIFMRVMYNAGVTVVLRE